MENILYFEGAGMDFYGEEQTKFSDVGNFRIRTAFKNNYGIPFYIELGSTYTYNPKNNKEIIDWNLRIDHLFKLEDRFKGEYITGGYEIKTNHLEIRKLHYTKETITKWINENLNCSFDTIQVLHSFYGYRVHGDTENPFNLMEDIDVNHDRAKARKESFQKIDMEYRKALNERYSKISLCDMDDKSLTIRCYASDESLSKTKLPRINKVLVNY